MTRIVSVTLAVLLVIIAVGQAQQVIPVNRTYSIAWNQDNVSVETAQGFLYTLYVDDQAVELTHICGQVNGVVECAALLPAMTPGKHTLTMTARNPVLPVSEGMTAKSEPLNVVFAIVPDRPNGLKIVVK